LRGALDSSPLWGAAKVEDTYNLLGHALRKALDVISFVRGSLKIAVSRLKMSKNESLLQELRQRQATANGRAKLRERVSVEHTLAHIGQWQGVRARYIGSRRNLFDLRRTAVVHNLHVLARMPELAGEVAA